jgi:hydrogenase/urease accessory protein HupE
VKPLPLAAALLLFAAAPAAAHTITPGTTGFTDGLHHPFGLPPHIMMILGIGLLLGQQEIAAWRGPLYGCLAGLGLGLAGGPLLVSPALDARLAVALLALAVLLGGMVALARPLPSLLLLALGTLTGFGLGLDSAPEGGTLQQTFGALAGSGFAMTFALLNVALLAQYAHSQVGRRAWQKIGVRIVGSWIAAAGIMVLALQLR